MHKKAISIFYKDPGHLFAKKDRHLYDLNRNNILLIACDTSSVMGENRTN